MLYGVYLLVRVDMCEQLILNIIKDFSTVDNHCVATFISKSKFDLFYKILGQVKGLILYVHLNINDNISNIVGDFSSYLRGYVPDLILRYRIILNSRYLNHFGFDLRDVIHLKRFVTEAGKIRPRSDFTHSRKYHSYVSLCIKHAREMAIMPYFYRGGIGKRYES